MKTRKESRAAVVAGLLLGLASHGANATDVVVAYGDHVALQARLAEQEFQARMSDYQKAVREGVEANLSKEVERIELPRIQVAVKDEPTLG